MLKLAFLLICVSLLLGVPGQSPIQGIAWADAGGIEVGAHGVESKFPDGIRFFLTASSPDPITDIRVFVRKLGRTGSSSYRPIAFEPGRHVTGESLLATGTGPNHVPPGTTMEYTFEVRDAAGRVYQTEKRNFIYLDNRFDWLTVSDGLITVYYYREFVAGQARSILEAARQALTRMGPVLGTQPTEPLRIVTYDNYRHMSAALPFRARAVREQLLTQGMAFTDERVLLVHGADPSFRGTVSHEFTHLLVAEATGSANQRVPAWLNEGLAEYGNVDPTNSYGAALRFGTFTRRLKPLRFLATFGGEPGDILIAYGQARSVVQYMIESYGRDKMAELMRAFQETPNIDRALERVYGFDQHGLDTLWRATVGLDPFQPPTTPDRPLQQPSDATPAPQPASPSAPEPTPTPPAPLLPAPELSPTPPTTPAPAGDVSSKDGSPQNPASGCSGPRPDQHGRVASDLAWLLLLTAPLAMVWARAVHGCQRTASTRPGVKGVVYRVAQQVEGEQQYGQSAHRKEQ